MVDASDSKSDTSNSVGVQVPSPVYTSIFRSNRLQKASIHFSNVFSPRMRTAAPAAHAYSPRGRSRAACMHARTALFFIWQETFGTHLRYIYKEPLIGSFACKCIVGSIGYALSAN